MDLNGKCNGYTNWGTYKTILILDNDEGYCNTIQGWVDDYSEQGMTKAQARNELANRIEEIVKEEFYDMVDEGSLLAQELAVRPEWMNINYNEIADDYLKDYNAKKGKSSSRSSNLKSSRGGKKQTRGTSKRGRSKFSLPSINKSRKHRWVFYMRSRNARHRHGIQEEI